ncbi:PTS galactitol transporter subunit IIC [Anaerococcus porci]|uniref:PTS galactitol transporter subunit IIC n=1 Tax=Anaerococcus porci TaxID=2652269 RepID=A0A6N7VGV7_9FIRM|nr:PTS transporter subunit IIC [Anaerococcus porci]MDY3005825.1 PTS transporter subunit IIC [Anaerococcus porci]MSS78680.1 PTS galactitol transporter subunit IIC [Anaerococcus porci]
MDLLASVINYILDMGAAVFMPLLMFVIGLIMKMKVKDAFKAGLTIGIAFTGMSLLIDYMGSTMGGAAKAMSQNTGISLPAVDIGWPGAASITWAWPLAFLVFPLQIFINIIMLVTKQTKTLNVDLWNVWNKIFSAILVSYFTNNVILGFVAASILIFLELKLGDAWQPEIERLTGIPNVTVPHFISLFAVIMYPVDELLKKIPLLNKELDSSAIREKIGIFGENSVMGAIIGLGLGVLAGYGIKGSLILSVQAATALTLFPMVSKLFSEALSPISEAVSDFMKKKYGQDADIYIGLDWPILGGRNELWVSVIITIPFLLLFSLILPGNKVLPFAGIINLSFVVAALLLTNGNVLRMIIHGIWTAPIFLYGATYFAPYMTRLAEETGTLAAGQQMIGWSTFEGPILRYLLVNGFNGDIIAIIGFVVFIVLYILLIKNRKKYNLELMNE